MVAGRMRKSDQLGLGQVPPRHKDGGRCQLQQRNQKDSQGRRRVCKRETAGEGLNDAPTKGADVYYRCHQPSQNHRVGIWDRDVFYQKGGRRITVLLISYSSIQNRKVLKNKIYKKNKRRPPQKKSGRGEGILHRLKSEKYPPIIVLNLYLLINISSYICWPFVFLMSFLSVLL